MRMFAGPIVCGVLSLAEDRRDDQEAALRTGEAMLAKGAVGHNHFWFRRYAIERALLVGDWDEADTQAATLLSRMVDEPISYASLVAERGRLLARYGGGEASETDEKKLAESRLAAAGFDSGSTRSAPR